jgi:SAM-dependent methyltransferase
MNDTLDPVFSTTLADSSCELTLEDLTPQDWALPRPALREKVKGQLRKVILPVYLGILNPLLTTRYRYRVAFPVTQWYWGARGFEHISLRALLNRYYKINGRTVLVVGCGTGRDLKSWLSYLPEQVVGVDLFNYKRAWKDLMSEYGDRLSLFQADMTKLCSYNDRSFDIVASDAVLEHCTNLKGALPEWHRLLRPGGILYASFGPLWYSWGGDHVSGYDKGQHGYNHLIAPRSAYMEYLSAAGLFKHSEHDGRTWVRYDLFSYLRLDQYLNRVADAGFDLEYLGVSISPKAIKCLKRDPRLRIELLKVADEFDLIAAAACVIARAR